MKAAKITSHLIVLFVLFVCSFLILLFYYFFIYSRLAFPQSNQNQCNISYTLPVSVIICARNEQFNLELFLPSILNQDYPEFEVIIVNDRSTDNTQELLEDLNRRYPQLRVIKNEDEIRPGKRDALKKGLEAARYDIVLLTDADCQPASREWIKLMTSALTPGTEIVLGYSPCFPKNGLLNLFIRYENFQTALNYFSFALTGKPYMGVGRNLLYRKSVPQQLGAFGHHKDLISGDDDMLVNQIANKLNTKVMIHPKSFVFTTPPESFKALIHQKRRHYSTGFHYLPKHQLSVGTLYAAQILFIILLVPLFINSYLFPVVISIFVIKNILQTLIYGKAMHRLNVHNLWIFTPALDVCLSLFFLTLGSLSFYKIKTWK